MLGGAAAGEDRDPHSFALPVRCAGGRLADDDRHFASPASSFGARRRELVDHPADLRRDFGLFFFDASGSGRRRGSFPPLRARSLPITFGTFAFSSPLETTIETRRARARPRCRRSATGVITCRRARRFLLRRRSGSRPRPRIRCTATPRWVPTRTGTLTSFGPARDGRGSPSSRWSRCCRRRGSEWITTPASTAVGVDLFGRDFEARLFQLLPRLLLARGRRSPGPCRCRGRR